jgi:hypothetical protein
VKERGVSASPYIVREAGLKVGSEREYYSSTSRSPPYSAGHVQLTNRVLILCSPCAPRHQVPCSASRVVPGAHRVVGPGTHRGSGPREVHTTIPRRYPMLPRSQRQGTLLQHWRSRPPPYPEHGRTAQAQLARSLHSCKGDWTRLVSPPDT